MKIPLKILATAAGLALIGSSAADAHHSGAMFDYSKSITLQGTITKFQWINPHSWIQILVKDDLGEIHEWSVECPAPTGLARQGWKGTSMKPGDKAVIVVHPLTNGNMGGFLVEARMHGVKVGH